ncbi:E3 ubiquitin-protein ligase RMA3-like [Coffea eugenioides]|uniref:E3 ubiquitin-protein ligase RMA3-like n=1 Tax=Coffea eugenioides TaxID=49369 RepID=UPI000F610781|nr:E3 ubiquitin-protein ligase RMA3-like [Coffea eugenioides]
MAMEFEQQLAQDLKSIPASKIADSEKASACFDCSICLESANDPVVTFCGHLYCWPCIYKWLELQMSSLTQDECTYCPICKAEISQESLVPLYGRGRSLSEPVSDDKVTSSSKVMAIPPRPNASARQAQATSANLRQQLPSNSPSLNLQTDPTAPSESEDSSSPALTVPLAVCHPMNGNYGEMIYARAFGNWESFYTFPNSYHTEGSASPRVRRQEIQAHKSLNRISVFLFCWILLCLFVF